jgi:hypothetical protein
VDNGGEKEVYAERELHNTGGGFEVAQTFIAKRERERKSSQREREREREAQSSRSTCALGN